MEFATSCLANVDDLRNLRYDSGAITTGRHARRLRYKIMSARMELIQYGITSSQLEIGLIEYKLVF